MVDCAYWKMNFAILEAQDRSEKDVKYVLEEAQVDVEDHPEERLVVDFASTFLAKDVTDADCDADYADTFCFSEETTMSISKSGRYRVIFEDVGRGKNRVAGELEERTLPSQRTRAARRIQDSGATVGKASGDGC